jgi:hypothetical protein
MEREVLSQVLRILVTHELLCLHSSYQRGTLNFNIGAGEKINLYAARVVSQGRKKKQRDRSATRSFEWL